MQDEPKVVTWVVMGIGAAWFLALGVAVNLLSPRLVGSSQAWMGPVLLTCTAGMGLVLAAGCAATFINWAVWSIGQRDEERKRMETITPRLMELQAAARLSPEQARLVPALAYRGHVVATATTEGLSYSLECPGGLVPYEWAVDFVKNCGQTDLQPVRNWSDGTHGRMYAQMVTEWCVYNQFALPAAGQNPARWLTEQSKLEALRLLGVEWPAD